MQCENNYFIFLPLGGKLVLSSGACYVLIDFFIKQEIQLLLLFSGSAVLRTQKICNYEDRILDGFNEKVRVRGME